MAENEQAGRATACEYKGEMGTHETNEAMPLRAIYFRLVARACECNLMDNHPHGRDVIVWLRRCLSWIETGRHSVILPENCHLCKLSEGKRGQNGFLEEWAGSPSLAW